MSMTEYLFPQDKAVEGKPNLREGGATMRDFFAFAFIARGCPIELAFKNADKILELRAKINE